MAKTRTVGGGVEVDGLAESIRAISRWDKAVRKEAVEIFRDEAKIVQAKAKANARAHPASSSATSWIGRSATGQGAGVKLIAHKGGGRGYATEFGMHKWHYRDWHGNVQNTIQSAMRGRTFDRFVGITGGVGPGYVIQPAIRAHLPGMEKRVANKLSALLTRELNRAGVPHGRH